MENKCPNHNIVYSCKSHIVWCTQYRRNVLVQKVAVRLIELIVFMCQDFSANEAETH